MGAVCLEGTAFRHGDGSIGALRWPFSDAIGSTERVVDRCTASTPLAGWCCLGALAGPAAKPALVVSPPPPSVMLTSRARAAAPAPACLERGWLFGIETLAFGSGLAFLAKLGVTPVLTFAVYRIDDATNIHIVVVGGRPHA